jgi:predicted lipoprotein with Yx(FWY)xxD motif
MRQTTHHKHVTRGVLVGRIAAGVVAVGGISVSAFAISTAGAVTNSAAKSVVISTMKNAKFGTVLVSGKTVYVLKASKVGCVGQCTKTWPEVLLPKGVTKATAGKGVTASKLGSVMRSGGVRQVTYSGKALYWFSYDTAAGQVNGNGAKDTWGSWSVVVTAKPATTPATTTTTAPSGGYGY